MIAVASSKLTESKTVSSAALNRLQVDTALDTSLTKMIKRRDDKTDPWRTPAFKSTLELRLLAIETTCVRSVKTLCSKETKIPWSPMLCNIFQLSAMSYSIKFF